MANKLPGNPRLKTAAKALLMAGLSLFMGPAALALTDATLEEAPARRIAAPVSPTPYPTIVPTSTPMPSVRPEELKAAESRLNAAIAESLRKASDQSELMSKELSGIKEKIQAIATAVADDKAQLDKQGKDAKILSDNLDDSQKRISDGLKKVDEVRQQIESKGQRMEGLLDLVNTLKRDLNDNSHEIAELKHDMESLKKLSQAPNDEQDWWDQLTSWKYMPLAAAVLSGVALGVAASHK